jgi:hypothetical protein
VAGTHATVMQCNRESFSARTPLAKLCRPCAAVWSRRASSELKPTAAFHGRRCFAFVTEAFKPPSCFGGWAVVAIFAMGVCRFCFFGLCSAKHN